MALIALDCGTTNSSMYVIDEHDQIIGKAVKKVGVKDTAETGSTEILKTGLREAYVEALADANISDDDVTMVLSNGMITSEIGLHCLPHLTAPVSSEDLGHNMVEVGSLDIFPKNVPVYFVRGVKNRVTDLSTEIDDVGLLDFMRGEETQVAGLLASGVANPPFTLVMLSSHTKYISVDHQARIAGSVTTLSGQLYAAMAGSSVLAKSLQDDNKSHSKDFSHTVIDSAQQWTEEVGLLRSMMMVRFMDVLMQTTSNERRTFMEACIAAQDMMALQQFSQLDLKLDAPFVLMGKSSRCNVYEYLLKKRFGAQHPITLYVDDEAIDALTVQGLLHLARKAKLLKDKE
ncbi:MAG: 2-dehydro-3-deoxygalactonokinase [Sphaerochaeta sp.]|jgi:2-dehydro-3-deoxygalactonokinase